ncbi:MAG: dienelactone hydrolase family protein [Actinobacteria bacterium]|nr:dienelactone hydrolase family protein [Actinomycetota bacterium]
MIEFDGLTAYLANGRGPGIVVLHEWWGLVPHIRDICDRFAALRFTAVAPDLYHGPTAPNTEPDDADRLLTALDRDRAIGEVAATVAELRRRGCAKVGTIGFCMGGALSLAASAACPVDATVAYYGVWPHSGERSIANPILVHVAEHEEHNWPALPAYFPKWFAGMSNAEVHIYWGTQHAFFNDTRPESYDEAAATLSWDRTVEFLRDAFTTAWRTYRSGVATVAQRA